MSASTEPIPASLDVTLQVPFDQLIHAYTQRPGPYSGDPDDCEEPPPVVLDVIGERVAQILAAEQKDEVRKLVRETLSTAIREQVQDAVRDAIADPVRKTNAWGEPTGEESTLRDVIVAEAKAWMTKETGDYNNRKTNAQKYIGAEVDRAIKADLDAALKAARAEITQRLKDQAATAITATIAAMNRAPW